MTLHTEVIKQILRPVWRPFKKTVIRSRTFNVSIHKLLRGGENGIRAAKYAELTQQFLRPSTSILEGPHVKILKLYNEIGDDIFKDEIFENTDYYKNAFECMKLTGSYFYDRPEKIKILVERLIHQFKNKNDIIFKDLQPGQSDPLQPVLVRPIKYSTCYEVIDGNHRIARAIMNGDTTIPVLIYYKEPVLTPLQQLLLDCLWINKQKWLYQPIDFPELKDEWKLIRKCTDRFDKMKNFLQSIGLTTYNKKYLDIGSSYGWFVKEFSKIGLNSFGIERDPFGIDVGYKVYGINKNQIIHKDIVLGLRNMIDSNQKYDFVSCLSVLHHFVLNKNSTSAEELIKLIDNVTNHVLFIDTGEEHESAFKGTLKGWSPEFIKNWIKSNTSFKEVFSLGVDQDCRPPFTEYYNRSLFACIR